MYKLLTRAGIRRASHLIVAMSAILAFSGSLSGCLYMAASKGIDAINHSNDNKAQAQCQTQYTNYLKQVTQINAKNKKAGLQPQHVMTMDQYCSSLKRAEASKVAL